MLTPPDKHYMRALDNAQLRAIIADPALYGVGERLDADAILRSRCGCPDDCGCRSPYRVTVCGCTGHAS